MVRTFVTELTSLLNSDSAWKVSKGRRSARRRNRNIAGKVKEHSNMPVSKSEKRGMSFLGCSSSDKVEQLPIKKRRFLLRTSSPPPPPPPPSTNETSDISKNQDTSNELGINPSNNNISDEVKNSKKASKVWGCDEDFSGISILTAAACSNNSSGKECGYSEEHSCVEECSIQEQSHEICVKSKESCSSEGLVNDELIESRDISRGGVSSCVSVEPVGELLSLSTSVNSFQNPETVGTCDEGAMSRDVNCSKNEEVVGKRCWSSRNVRLHWDLNVVMDDWELPFEDSDAHNEVPHNKSDDGERYRYDDERYRLEEGLGSKNTLATLLETSQEYNNLNQTKLMVEDANYVNHLESVSNVDQLVTSVLDDRCQLSEAITMNKGEDLFSKNPKLNDEETRVSIEKIDLKTIEPVSSDISLHCVEVTDYESSKYETASNDNEIQQVTSKELRDSFYMDNNLCLSDRTDTIEKHENSSYGVHLDWNSASVVRVSSTSRLHEGYDSQYEDGELREETNECKWEPIVCEEDMETRAISPVHYHVSKLGHVDVEKNVVMEVIVSTIPPDVNNNFENEGSSGYEGDKYKINSNSLTRSEESHEMSRSSLERVTDVGDGNDKNILVDTERKIEAKSSYTRGLRSQIETPVLQDGSCRDKRIDKVENRYEETSCVRPYERVRYPVHGQSRGRDLRSWNGSLDGRRGFKRRYSPIFHRRLKGDDDDDDDDDGIVEEEDIGCVDSHNNASYSLHSRYKPQRKFSPDRPSTFGIARPLRGGRGRYNNGPSKDEIFQSSLKYRRPLSHGDRSLSPFGVQPQPNAYQSRSRSRSPLMWNPQRERGGGGNTIMRRRSRSPDFRSEVRAQRPRSPPIHMGLKSFPRNNYNSPRHSRWTSGRKDESGHFRDFGCKQQRSFTLERSPGQGIKRTNRPGVIDGYYRISDEGGSGDSRELRFKENYEDKRKQHYGIHCANRSHQDMNDTYSGNNIRDRDTTSGFQGRGARGILPRLRGEHHSRIIHERNGKFNSDVMVSSSDMQSEEQFQPQPRRFPIVEGHSRGRRYEKYGGGVYRRNELEGVEKRPNHLFDRDFKDGPFYPPRGVRNFEGQIGNLATRLGEHREEEKLEDNVPPFGGGNSDDHDMPNARVCS